MKRKVALALVGIGLMLVGIFTIMAMALGVQTAGVVIGAMILILAGLLLVFIAAVT